MARMRIVCRNFILRPTNIYSDVIKERLYLILGIQNEIIQIS